MTPELDTRPRAVVAGGTGFVGRGLVDRLLREGWEVVILTRGEPRGEGVRRVWWDGRSDGAWARELEGARAVVNLAGEPIVGPWTGRRRGRILQSRVEAGRALARAIARVSRPPEVLVQASAIGFYGDRGDEELDEDAPGGSGFLPEVTRAWEASTEGVEVAGTRRVVTRLGVVLGHGGFVGRMVVPFKMGLGLRIGSGRQWLSWIHREDVAGAIAFLIARTDLSGVCNVVAPHPVRSGDFTRELARAVHRPAVLALPSWVVRAMGGLGREVLLASQRVRPRRLLEAGFVFAYPDVAGALAASV